MAILAILAGSFAAAAPLAPPAAADTNCPAASVGLSGAGTTSGDPYLIQSQGDLQLVKTNTAYRSGYFRQTQNIDMQATTGTDCVWDAGINSTFSGTYDGGGYEITGLNITSSRSTLGLFESVTGSISNLGFAGDVTSSSTSGSAFYVGTLVGYLNGGSITDSHTSGSVESVYADINFSGTGGLVGVARSGASISGSYATGDVSAKYSAGGLVGRTVNSTPFVQITESYATGDVSASIQAAGGFSGNLYNATVTKSFATGDVSFSGSITSTHSHFGGFSGVISNATVTDSYSTGGVAGGNNQVGGFVGDYASLGTNLLARTYSATISGFSTSGTPTEYGGYVGYGYPSGANSATTSFWNYETSGYTSSDSGTGSGSSTGVLGRSTSELKDITTFTDGTVGVDWNTGGATTIAEGYDASYTWGLCSAVNSGYPFLTAFYTSDPCSNAPVAGDTTRPTATFHFRLPDGRECSPLSPQLVYTETTYILPGAGAACRTPGAELLGWAVPHQDWDFAPGATVYVVESQVFTAVLRQPTIAITWDANVGMGDLCLATAGEPDTNASLPQRHAVTYLDRADMSAYPVGIRPALAEYLAPIQATCTPPGLTLTGWTISTPEGTNMVLPGDNIDEAITLASPDGGVNNFTFHAKWSGTPSTQTVTRAGFYEAKSNQLSTNGQQDLQELLASVPANASNIHVDIIGVSNSLDTPAANKTLATQRAARLQRELQDSGLTATYRASTDPTLVAPSTSSTGKQLSTVRITYEVVGSAG